MSTLGYLWVGRIFINYINIYYHIDNFIICIYNLGLFSPQCCLYVAVPSILELEFLSDPQEVSGCLFK